MRVFPTGKLPPAILDGFLKEIPQHDTRVLTGAQVGDDAAVIKFGSTCLVAKTDPITFIAERIGWYAVHINANDIAVLGAKPKWFLACVLLPEGKTNRSLVKAITKDLLKTLEEIHVTLVGGHTEVTPGLDRPIIAGHMLGEVQQKNLIQKKHIRTGDHIILVRSIPVEGTSIIASLCEKDVTKKFGKRFAQRCRKYIYNPGISVLPLAQTAAKTGLVTGMHDPTEGGLLGGIWELAFLRKLGAEINADRITIFPDAQKLCSYFQLDPLRLIASGSLICTTRPANSTKVIAALNRKKIPAAVIGRFIKNHRSFTLTRNGKTTAISLPIIDEINKLF